MSSLSWVESFGFGILQGLTEFFPVSSDGHIVLVRHLTNYHENILVFDVLLHLGTLGSLLFFFKKDVKQLLLITFQSLKSRRPRAFNENHRWMFYIWLTTLTTGIFGLLFETQVAALFTSLKAAAWGFLVTSVALFIGSRFRFGQRSVISHGWWFPVAIGVAQALALLPGVSRSGMTIALALILGIKQESAGRYSFIAAIPIIFLASLYELAFALGSSLDQLPVIFVGVVASFFTGLLALKGLMYLLTRSNLYPFAIYTGVLGACTLFYWV